LILPVTDPCPKKFVVKKGALWSQKVPVKVRAEPSVGHGQFSLTGKVFDTMAGLNYTISSPHPAFNFADRVCDARVDSPSSAVTAYFALTRGRLSVPLPLANPCKIVVVGDTGLRIKSTNDGWCKEDMGKPETLYSAKTCPAENMTAEYDPTKVSGLFQSASKSIDPASNGWVWDKVAAEASWEVRKAQGKAVVLHVGDYTYRHEACPMPFPTELTPEQEETRRVFGDCTAVADHWGDTSEGWVADFFQPAVPLLRAAPWVVLRGNHETCKRGGMGWFRYLEPRPADSATFPGATSNHPWCVTETPPYSVDFLEEQWLVIDSSDVSNEDVSIDKTPEQAFSAEDAEAIAGKPVLPLGAKCEGEDSGKADLWMVSGLLDLVHPGKRHWIAVHRPVSGLTFESVKNAPNQLYSFQCELANTMNLANITIDNVPAIVSGHVHYFQLVQYQEGTAQIAVGNSGTQLKTPYNGEPLGLEQVAGTGATVLGDEVVNSPSVGQWGYAVLTTRPSGHRR